MAVDRLCFELSGRLGRLLMVLPPRLVFPILERGQSHHRPGRSVSARRKVSTSDAGGVRVVWLDRHRAERGVVVVLHGGAYILGPRDDQWRWLDELVERTGMAGAMVIYRMPPAHPHPAAIDDAFASLVALQEVGVLAAGEWFLAGDSAGGGLALAATRRLLDSGRIGPAGLALSSPWVDLTMANVPTAAEQPDGLAHRTLLEWAARLYAGDTALDDAELSPLNGSFDGFPPVHVNVGSLDLLVPEVSLLADRLREAEVPVELIEATGEGHSYPLAVERPAAQAALDAQAEWISQLLLAR